MRSGSYIRRKTSFGLLLAASFGCGAADAPTIVGPPPQASDTAIVNLDNRVSYQAFAGFGGTTLTLVYPTGDYLGPLRSAAVKAAFGDVGISRGALQIGVSETPANATDRWGQRANDNPDPFVINPSGFNFADSDVLRNRVLIPAAAYGYSDLTLGPFISLQGQTSWLGGIRAVDYGRYLDEAAEHVLAVLQHWRDSYGLVPSLLYLFNEPTSGNRELNSFSTQEVVDLVKRIGSRLWANGFNQVRFLVPNEETIGRSLEVARAILADPAARPFVGAIGYHPYPYGSVYASPRNILETSGSGTPDRATVQQLQALQALGVQYGVPVWMTEVSEGPGNTDYGFDAIENVLARAIHIHDNFEYAGAAAYFGMVTIWDSRSHAEHFAGRLVPFLSEQSGMVLADLDAGRVLITGMGYAVGHYARWLNIGAIRIEATSDEPRIIAAAFRDAARGRIIVVVVNTLPGEQLLQIAIDGATPAAAITGEVSAEAARWRAIPAFSAAGPGLVSHVVPPRSVTTLAIPVR